MADKPEGAGNRGGAEVADMAAQRVRDELTQELGKGTVTRGLARFDLRNGAVTAFDLGDNRGAFTQTAEDPNIWMDESGQKHSLKVFMDPQKQFQIVEQLSGNVPRDLVTITVENDGRRRYELRRFNSEGYPLDIKGTLTANDIHLLGLNKKLCDALGSNTESTVLGNNGWVVTQPTRAHETSDSADQAVLEFKLPGEDGVWRLRQDYWYENQNGQRVQLLTSMHDGQLSLSRCDAIEPFGNLSTLRVSSDGTKRYQTFGSESAPGTEWTEKSDQYKTKAADFLAVDREYRLFSGCPCETLRLPDGTRDVVRMRFNGQELEKVSSSSNGSLDLWKTGSDNVRMRVTVAGDMLSIETAAGRTSMTTAGEGQHLSEVRDTNGSWRPLHDFGAGDQYRFDDLRPDTATAVSGARSSANPWHSPGSYSGDIHDSGLAAVRKALSLCPLYQHNIKLGQWAKLEAALDLKASAMKIRALSGSAADWQLKAKRINEISRGANVEPSQLYLMLEEIISQ